LDAAVECIDLVLPGEFTGLERWPGTFIPARKNKMRPFLTLGLRNGEELDACVRMIADRFPLGSKGKRYLAEPTQIKRAGKFDIQFIDPIAGASRNLHPMHLPTELVERGFCCAKEFRERSARGKKWN
jgi:hypothetical protein